MSELFDANALVVPFEKLRMSDVEVVGGKNASLPITLTGTAASSGDDWQLLKVRFTSKEGAAFDGTIYYYNRVATGKLRASITSINTTLPVTHRSDVMITELTTPEELE